MRVGEGGVHSSDHNDSVTTTKRTTELSYESRKKSTANHSKSCNLQNKEEKKTRMYHF